jgi:hypothetical protein
MNYIIESYINKLAQLLEDLELPVLGKGGNVPQDRLPAPHGRKGQNLWGHVSAGMKQGLAAYKADPKAALKAARAIYENKELLTDEAGNPKLAKGEKEVPQFVTKGLTLSPSNEADIGVDMCPCATKECRETCLFGTGRGSFDKKVHGARIARTRFMAEHPEHFAVLLHHEIATAKKKAAAKGQKLAVRPNVVSDVVWEKVHPELFHEHPDVQYYDYTKIAGRTKKAKPDNYHLTLSSTGVEGEGENWKHASEHLNNGGVVAMVFDTKKGQDLPKQVVDHSTGKTYRVIDGDTHDHRHLDKVYNDVDEKEGVIAGLRFKSSGHKRDEFMEKAGNFVVPVDGDTSHVNKPNHVQENYHYAINPAIYWMHRMNKR